MANWADIIGEVVVAEFLEGWKATELDYLGVARDYSPRVRSQGNTIKTGVLNLEYDGTDSGSDADNRIQVRDNVPYGEFEYDKVDPGKTEFSMTNRKVVAVEFDNDLIDSAWVDPVRDTARAEGAAMRMAFNNNMRTTLRTVADALSGAHASQKTKTDMTVDQWNSVDKATIISYLEDLTRMRKRMELNGGTRLFLVMHPWVAFKLETFVLKNGDYGSGLLSDNFLRSGSAPIRVGWNILQDAGLGETNNPEKPSAGAAANMYKIYAGAINESLFWAQRQIQAFRPIDLRAAKKLGFGIVGAWRYGSAALQPDKVYQHSINFTA